MEFTRSLEAFKNMTEPIRRSLCKVLVFAWVESAGTVVLKDQELLDSWSVIINGQVQVKEGPFDGDGPIRILDVGHSFGVSPTMDQQKHSGVMTTVTDDCQFLIVAQQEYFEVLNAGKEKQKQIYDDDGNLVAKFEWRQSQQGNQGASILIGATPERLLLHLLEDQTQDETYAEDYLLTYRAFDNSAEKIFMKLLESLDNQMRRGKVVRLVLLWVNNHFSDFENDWKLMALLEKFDEKLKNSPQPSTGEVKLLRIACNAKSKKRCVHIKRGSNEDELGFELWGGAAYSCPVYISPVHTGSNAEKLGVKRGDQVIEVNGQNVEKLVLDKAHNLIKKNTELRLLLKTSLFCFKEMIENSGPARKDKSSMRHSGPFSSTGRGLKSKHRAPSMTTLHDDVFIGKVSNKGGTLGRIKLAIPKRLPLFSRKTSMGFLDYVRKHGQDPRVADDSILSSAHNTPVHKSATLDPIKRRGNHGNVSASNPNLAGSNERDNEEDQDAAPEDVVKIYRSDQSHRYIFINKNTTAAEAVIQACKEFAIQHEVHTYSLYKVSVQGGQFIKRSKLPDMWVNLADLPLGARYYLKNQSSNEVLLPDDNIG